VSGRLPVLAALWVAAAGAPAPTATTTTAISTATSTSSEVSAGPGTTIPPPGLALPPPLPPPEALQPPVRAEPDDALDLLWSHRLNFAAGGAPLVTIRLMEGQEEIAFRPRGPAHLRARGGTTLRLPAGELFRVRALGALPAALAHYPLLAEVPHADRAGLEAARRAWEERGVKVRQRLVGGVYGIAGRVIDNRKVLLLADGDGSEGWARDLAETILAQDGTRPPLFGERVSLPQGQLELLDAGGVRLALGDALLTLEVDGDQGFALLAVEHDVGYAAHGREDRAFGGRLHVTLDASGRLAAVNAVALEELLRGLVPSEMPSGSPREALRAQAVTARSNVLAQIGTRHLTDPYVLCSEVHCQAYRGRGAHHPATDAAVRDTRGEALFGRRDRSLVDGVYSALCGGHGEDNDAVWGGLPDPSLRGRPDLTPREAARWEGGLRDEARLRSFLEAAPASWCAVATGARKDRFRWERRFTAAELDAAVATLGVGSVKALEVGVRGVSGRARELRVMGGSGSAVVQGELRIRRLLRNLPSAMFVVERDAAGWVLRGGGWGHGAGMCQWGAVGRAEAGQGYREILRAYFDGAEAARIY
jgi:SpoIID/LytB domain protein